MPVLPNTLFYHHDKLEILLKVALNTLNPKTLLQQNIDIKMINNLV